jgi:hypothetical protein
MGSATVSRYRYWLRNDHPKSQRVETVTEAVKPRHEAIYVNY